LKKAIITGGNGFIGRHLVKRLLANKQCSVVLIANTPKFMDKRVQETNHLTFYVADIRDREYISNIFRDEKADTCIHLAAKISVTDSTVNPKETMDINVAGTLNVLEACHRSGVNNFVFTSSAAVYGDVGELPISENQTLRPLSPYGSSKMFAEQHVSSYSRLKKIQNSVTLRIFNVYGKGQSNEADVITKFASRLSKGLSPIIFGDGSQTRDFISVDDVVDGILLSIRALERSKNKSNNNLTTPVFNLGTGIPTTINQLAQKMIAIFGHDLEPIYKEPIVNDAGIMQSYADMSRTKEALHFVPKKGIEIGLREIIAPMRL
jgi:UDP-glucose 4-epimerase